MALTSKRIVRGEKKKISIQVTEDGLPKNITGMGFKFAVKLNMTDTAYKIGPVDGAIENAAEGKISFTLTPSMTDIDPFAGVYEVAMYDGETPPNKTVLTPAGGLSFTVLESIID